jgi:hypothetical protein
MKENAKQFNLIQTVKVYLARFENRTKVVIFILSTFVVVTGLLSFIRQLSLSRELSRAQIVYEQLKVPATTIPILIPCFSRPEYLQQTLDKLAVLDNINSTVVIFSQDGNNAAISKLIDGFTATKSIHLRHQLPYPGIPSFILPSDTPTASNVYFLLHFAMDYLHARAAIVLESDLILSKDAFNFFQWSYWEVFSRPDLRRRVFTINGYYERSNRDILQNNDDALYEFTSREYGFMVWGWLCPDFSWHLIKSGFTWFGNWDIILEHKVRRKSYVVDPSNLLSNPIMKYLRTTRQEPLVSLSPRISRVRNIGMQGINFNVKDPDEIAKWSNLYIPDDRTISFGSRNMKITDSN